MSDGFDFRPPPARREARRFEPPPWERDQFEQMARERAEQEAAERELAERLAAKSAQQQTVDAENPTAQSVPARPPAAAPAESDAEPAGQGAAKAEPDAKLVAQMMLELRAEEPETLKGAWAVSLGSGLVVALAGFVIAVWGGFALSNPRLGQLGKLGGGILIVFGIGFIGTGAWLIFRALRQRGVL